MSIYHPHIDAMSYLVVHILTVAVVLYHHWVCCKYLTYFKRGYYFLLFSKETHYIIHFYDTTFLQNIFLHFSRPKMYHHHPYEFTTVKK